LCTSFGWVWSRTSCQVSPSPGPSPGPSPSPSPSPVPAPPAINVASFVFRIRDFEFESWTYQNTIDFQNGIQALLKDGVATVRVRAVRSGSVIVDTDVTVADASQLPSIHSIFTSPDYLQQVGVYGTSLTGMAVSSEANVCTNLKTLKDCIASSSCGWCSKFASCLPGTSAGATVPVNSFVTCSGSDWRYHQSESSCSSIFGIVSTYFSPSYEKLRCLISTAGQCVHRHSCSCAVCHRWSVTCLL
jgi:hypothetical protein